ncbi:MAG: XRE family transcriptional regulator [Rickettsiales bacterium]|nr:XRE family transcriptional regulator [Rickettsiales bacterium]
MSQNNIRQYIDKSGMTVQQVADKAGTSRGQIYNLMKGERGLDFEWMKRLAVAFECEPEDLISSRKFIPLVGYVGAGQEIHAIDDHAKGAGLDEVDVPPGSGPNTVAVRVKGDSMQPAMQEGWLLYYSNRVEGGCEDLIGSLCVMKVLDGPTLVKNLRKGYAKGCFNLHSYNAEVIEDVRLEWCAKVEFIKPA